MRVQICEKNNAPHSDNVTNKIFYADGKEWLVGQYNITWHETRHWSEDLGHGWCLPEIKELEKLFKKKETAQQLAGTWYLHAEKRFKGSRHQTEFFFYTNRKGTTAR